MSIFPKFLSFLTIFTITTAAFSPVAFAVESESSFKITKKIIGEESITVTINPTGPALKSGDQYMIRCESQNPDFDEVLRETSTLTNIKLDGMIPGMHYKCDMGIAIAPNGLVPFFQPKFDVYTDSTTNPIKLNTFTSGSNSAQFTVNSHVLEGKDLYYVECQKGDKTFTNSSNERENILIEGLQPNTDYSCFASLIRNKYPYKKSSSFTITTSKDVITIGSVESDETFAVFNLLGSKPGAGEKYKLTCTNEVGDKKLVTSTKQTAIVLKDLKPGTEYSCQAAVLNDSASTLTKTGPSRTIKTTDSTAPITISEIKVHDTFLDFNFNARPLKDNEDYYLQCIDLANSTKHKKYTKVQLAVVIGNLQPENRYQCFAAIISTPATTNTTSTTNNTAKPKLTNKSGTVTVSTISPLKEGTIIDDFISRAESVEFSLKSSNKAAATGINYGIDCSNGTAKKLTGTSEDPQKIVIVGFQPHTDYQCFAYITDQTNTPTEKGPLIFVRTSDDNDKNKAIAPPAKYPDTPITSWQEFKNPFPDTDLNTLKGKAAAELFRRQVIQGYEDGDFKGHRDVTRAEAAKFLLVTRYETVKDQADDGRFTDTDPKEWYSKYIMRAADLGIINGYPNKEFRPGFKINRAEFIKMVTKTFDLEENLVFNYKDIPANQWFEKYVGVAERYNLFPDAKDQLNPNKTMSRHDVAIAIYQFLKNRD